MQPFRCGCEPVPHYPEDFCHKHFDMACHTPDGKPGECPVCWRDRMASVSLDSAIATLHRANTRPGIPPHVRLAEKDEFDPALNLTQHSKVREKRENL